MLKRNKGYGDIRPHDTVTLSIGNAIAGNRRVSGHVVMRSPVGWVVNTGGQYGEPHIVSEENFIGFGDLVNGKK